MSNPKDWILRHIRTYFKPWQKLQFCTIAYNKLLDVTHTHTTLYTGETFLVCHLQIDRFYQLDQLLLITLGCHHRGFCNNINVIIYICTNIKEYMYWKSAGKVSCRWNTKWNWKFDKSRVKCTKIRMVRMVNNQSNMFLPWLITNKFHSQPSPTSSLGWRILAKLVNCFTEQRTHHSVKSIYKLYMHM